MSDTNNCFHVLRSATEAAATPRSLRTILEALLTTKLGASFKFDSPLVVSIAIYNSGANPIKVQSDSAVVADNYPINGNTFRQWPAAGAFRYPLNEIIVNVTADNDPFIIEVLFE